MLVRDEGSEFAYPRDSVAELSHLPPSTPADTSGGRIPELHLKLLIIPLGAIIDPLLPPYG